MPILKKQILKGQVVYHLAAVERIAENVNQSGEVTLPLFKDSAYVAVKAKHPEEVSIE